MGTHTLTKRGQGTLEFTILIVIVIGVFVAMQFYLKRGIQGRWQSSVNEFGDQYDPRLVNSLVNYSIVSNSQTEIKVVPATGGYYTTREDKTSAVEKKEGYTAVGSFDKDGNPIQAPMIP